MRGATQASLEGAFDCGAGERWNVYVLLRIIVDGKHVSLSFLRLRSNSRPRLSQTVLSGMWLQLILLVRKNRSARSEMRLRPWLG